MKTGRFSRTEAWRTAVREVEDAVRACVWPPGSNDFAINPTPHGNGVRAIKDPCVAHLADLGWQIEALPRLDDDVLTAGDLDALKQTGELDFIGFEWETGNISSSHRAVNKLVMGMMHKTLRAGFLTLPSDLLYPYLTDRVGNIRELRPYLPLWANVALSEGVLRIVVVEHDRLDANVEQMPKMTDGRALR